MVILPKLTSVPWVPLGQPKNTYYIFISPRNRYNMVFHHLALLRSSSSSLLPRVDLSASPKVKIYHCMIKFFQFPTPAVSMSCQSAITIPRPAVMQRCTKALKHGHTVPIHRGRYHEWWLCGCRDGEERHCCHVVPSVIHVLGAVTATKSLLEPNLNSGNCDWSNYSSAVSCLN